MLIRPTEPRDIAKIQKIFAHEVLTGFATFEVDPPDQAAHLAKWQRFTDLGLPQLVAEGAGGVTGFSHAGPYRPRPAYDHTLENSVYVDADHRGKGIGKALLARLIERAEQGPWTQMVAVIGDSGNLGSIALHRAAGFRHVGTLSKVGYKFDRWVDTVIMQRSLGE